MKKTDVHRTARHDMMKAHHIEQQVHDPYKARGKLPELTLCPQCGAVLHRGHWQWADEVPKDAHKELCPACHRINDKFPAGELTLGGHFLELHRAEIIRLARNIESKEQAEHPLQRIMAIEEHPDRVLITTTDVHLPRRIGHAIVDAYKGEIETHYDEAGYFARIRWQRDA